MSENNEIYALAEKVAKDLPPDHDPDVMHGYQSPMKSDWFPLTKAYLCGNCDAVGNNSRTCPGCAGTGLMSLSAIVNRSQAEQPPTPEQPTRNTGIAASKK
jgi:hypothetical protein